jgi:hypothetical protein
VLHETLAWQRGGLERAEEKAGNRGFSLATMRAKTSRRYAPILPPEYPQPRVTIPWHVPAADHLQTR